MPGSDKQSTSQIRSELGRHLRSSSPAIKRPASDMGASDREEYTQDVEMEGTLDSSVTPQAGHSVDKMTKAKQQDTGRRHSRSSPALSPTLESGLKAPRQDGSSEDSVGTSSTSIPNNTSRTSTAATSVNLGSIISAPVDVPSIDEQIGMVTDLINKPAKDRQKGYVVSMKWLQRLAARAPTWDGQSFDKSATDGEIGPVDSSDLVMIMDDSGQLRDSDGEPYIFLKPGLSKGDDYRILPQEAWDLVTKWYGHVGPTITRFAHSTSDGEDSNCEYETEVPVFSLLKVPHWTSKQTSLTEANDLPVRILASRSTLFRDWLVKAKLAVNIPMNIKVRPWKILGGFKNSSTSGMLTPAASRSASPAPGANVVVNAGDRMVLNVNDFAALTVGDQRELVDQKDETANTNYNGKSLTLGIAGLSRDEVIVLEEQKIDGKWPSEQVKFTMKGNKGSAFTKGFTNGGRLSPGPSILTRGRQRANGRPRGITGLVNLGNTCYMNSALQCIRSVQELTEYFLHGDWTRDLNQSNPLGHNGNVAKAYAELLQNIYADGNNAFSPSKFKSVVGRYGPNFSGYGQQDSQEFLLFLLDGLQEDLNRIQKKPYIEKPDSTDEMVHDSTALKAFADKNWDDYKARNDSVVTDLFAGMYKSTVTCPVCSKVSIIFDPFSNLTLQLPVENTWSREVLFFPLHKRPIRIDVEVEKYASVKDIKSFVSKRTGVEVDRLVMSESYRNRFYKMFNNSLIMSEANLHKGDVVALYELDSIPTNYTPNKARRYSSLLFSSQRDSDDQPVNMDSEEADRLLVPVFHRKQKANSKLHEFFGEASYVVIGRDDSKSYDRVLQKLLGIVATMTTLNIFEDDITTASITPEGSDTVLMTDDGFSTDSNNVQATSVQGEEGMIDISMGDASVAPASEVTKAASEPHRYLQPGEFIPVQLQNLFAIKVTSTNDAIPTGWNDINESSDYELISERMPKVVTHRPARKKGVLSVVNGTSESVTSDEDDTPDIPHDSGTPENVGSGSDSNGANSHQWEDESDPGLPDVSTLTNASEATSSTKDKKRAMESSSTLSSASLVRPGEAIVLDWTTRAYDDLFTGSEDDEAEFRGCATWKSIDLLKDEELIAKRQKRVSRKNTGITLDDCLNEFGKSETLSENNAWYCPRCKEHRRAEKKFELWKVPDILVMHLKRFSSNRNFRDKLELKVDYPTEGLDMTSRVIDQEDGRELIYDLISVDNHYGGLGGGHYTAYGKNFVNDAWYEYNDAHVSQRNDPGQVVSNAAYLLFYRRRSNHPLGGPELAKIMEDANATEAVSEMQNGSRDPSPSAGEGQRLGGSSHNGSSSAFPPGQAHRVGDGGALLTTEHDEMENQGVGLQDGNLPSYTQVANDTVLPGYSAEDEVTAVRPWNLTPNPWAGMGVASVSRMTESGAYSDPGEGDGSSMKAEGAELNSPNSVANRMNDFSGDEDFVDAEPMELSADRRERESAPPPGHDEDDEVDKMIIQQLHAPAPEDRP